MHKLLIGFVLFHLTVTAQQLDIYPPNWYVGFNDSNLQLIIHAPKIGTSLASKSKDFTIVQVLPTQHKDYLIVNCKVNPKAKPQWVELELKGAKKLTIQYELKAKKAQPQTLTGNDLIYLIMPDRFANGDPKNDHIKYMREKTMNRDSIYGRHGGDLKGITQKMPYLDSLGITSLWLTPFQENDEPSASYHGYAITDHYKIDPRLGNMKDYEELIQAAKLNQKKLVLDLVFNHIGDGHWLFEDKPFKGVIHEFDSFTRTNYRANTLMDPYASGIDKKLFTEGWFDNHMPDLNTDDPVLSQFLIQNTLWWIETSQADGIRIDTYSYPDPEFMAHWYKVIKAQYPSISVFGEIWEHAVPLQSYFVPKEKSAAESMQHVLDFQFCFAIDDAVNNADGWTEGVSKLYYALSQDYLYNDPYHHIIFNDNHDLDRFFALVNYDMKKWKAAMAMLFTMRGIPSIFYGTEILMRNKGSHGIIREDFKGGWKEDAINKFSATGRTEEENEAWNYIQLLAQWRKNNSALDGKMMQFIPQNGVYVYFRYSENKKVMVVFNSKKENQTIQLKRYEEMLNGANHFYNVLTKQDIKPTATLTIPGGEVMVLEVYP